MCRQWHSYTESLTGELALFGPVGLSLAPHAALSSSLYTSMHGIYYTIVCFCPPLPLPSPPRWCVDQRSRRSAHMCTCDLCVAQQKKRLRRAVTTALALLYLSSARERDDQSRCVALSHSEPRLLFFFFCPGPLHSVSPTFAHNHS